MNWKRYTAIFIVTIFISIAVYDTVAIYNGGTEASISHMLILWSYNYPLFTFLMGVIMGHLFWRMRDVPDTKSLGRGNE